MSTVSVRRVLAASTAALLLVGGAPAFTGTASAAAPAITFLTNPVNAAKADAVNVSGTADAGSLVSVTARDASGRTTSPVLAAAGIGGSWTRTLDVRTLDDGLLTVTATVGGVSDSAGTKKDTQAPAAPKSLTSSPATVVNRASASAVEVSAAAASSDTSTLRLSISDGTSSVRRTFDSTGTPTHRATFDTSALADGPLTVTAEALDDALNISIATRPLNKDATAPTAPTVTFSKPVAGATTETVTVSGTTSEAGAPYAATITDSEGKTAERTGTTTDAKGYSFPLELSGFADGTITVRVVVTDAAGNAGAPGTGQLTKDTVNPSLSLAATPNPVNVAAAGKLTVTGTTDGTKVTLTVSGTSGSATSSPVLTPDDDGAFKHTFDVSGYPDDASGTPR